MVMSDVYAGGDLAGHGMRRIAERADALLDCPSRDAVLVQDERQRFQPDIHVDVGDAGQAFQSVLDLEPAGSAIHRSEEHTSELQSLMRISYAVFCLKKKNNEITN